VSGIVRLCSADAARVGGVAIGGKFTGRDACRARRTSWRAAADASRFAA
jgi:hypothetical protein